VAADAAGDAAVLRIDTGGRDLPFLALGPAPECGAAVTVISHPVGRFYCLTEGVVSRYHRQQLGGPEAGAAASPGSEPARAADAVVWMSVTADYAVGSSGGPVFNAAGEVVGMVSRTFSSRPGRRPRGGPASEQMVFKDCVSLDTLQRLCDTVR
jgi:serine protease Do